MSEKIKPFKIVSPGEIITSMLDSMGWSQSDLSEITGLTPKTIRAVPSATPAHLQQ